MNINNNKSFKDIIQSNNIDDNNNNDDEYNEFKNKELNNTSLKIKDKLVLDFIDEHLTTICNTIKDLKDINNINGFLNNIKYKDIIDILISNMNVDEIISDIDENDQYWDDDEH